MTTAAPPAPAELVLPEDIGSLAQLDVALFTGPRADGDAEFDWPGGWQNFTADGNGRGKCQEYEAHGAATDEASPRTVREGAPLGVAA